MFHGIVGSLVAQCPGLGSPTSEVQAQPPTLAVRLHKPPSTEDKEKDISERGEKSHVNKQNKKEQTDKTPKQMVKATLNRQEHQKKLMHSQRGKKRGKKSKNRNQRRREQSSQSSNL